MESGRPRQGLRQVARTDGGDWPARRGGDLGSPRKPAGAAPAAGGLPLKARLPPYPPRRALRRFLFIRFCVPLSCMSMCRFKASFRFLAKAFFCF